MKKNYMCACLCLLLILCPSIVTASDITLDIDGNKIVSDVTPEVKNGTTFVPLRVVSESLGAEVEYNGGIVTVAKEGQRIVLPLDGSAVKVYLADGQEQTMNLDSGVFVKKGRTMVPLRFVAEALNMQVNYLSGEQKVQIISRKNLVIDGLDLKYATTYTRIGMGRRLEQFSGYGVPAAMYETLQNGLLREVAEPNTPYGSMFEISDYYMEQYIVGFYEETPLYKKNSGENATNANFSFVLYKMLEGTFEYGSDSQYLLYDVQNGKWYIFAAESYDVFTKLLAENKGVLLETI